MRSMKRSLCWWEKEGQPPAGSSRPRGVSYRPTETALPTFLGFPSHRPEEWFPDSQISWTRRKEKNQGLISSDKEHKTKSTFYCAHYFQKRRTLCVSEEESCHWRARANRRASDIVLTSPIWPRNAENLVTDWSQVSAWHWGGTISG